MEFKSKMLHIYREKWYELIIMKINYSVEPNNKDKDPYSMCTVHFRNICYVS